MTSLFPVICTDDVRRSKDFYVSLFGLRSVFEIDWYVQLQSPSDPHLQLAFVRREHPSVPSAYRDRPRGVFVTLEVDDVDGLHARAVELGLEIFHELRDEAWGQRHFMVRDPNGLAVDVVKMIEPSPEFVREHGLS